jgi:hypothetical protein
MSVEDRTPMELSPDGEAANMEIACCSGSPAGRAHAVSLLDALVLERAVDAGWTPARRPAKTRTATRLPRHVVLAAADTSRRGTAEAHRLNDGRSSRRARLRTG